MVMGKLPVPGRPTIWIIVGQGPIALVEGWGLFGHFSLLYPFPSFSLFPSLWETARYRLKYDFKGNYVVLLFCVHVKHLRSCRDGQLT